jgi:hypothetical protein
MKMPEHINEHLYNTHTTVQTLPYVIFGNFHCLNEPKGEKFSNGTEVKESTVVALCKMSKNGLMHCKQCPGLSNPQTASNAGRHITLQILIIFFNTGN